ncbi:tripartite tricarboxylate transporter substrate-binding protein, partial [Neisseria sp. P0015.S009]|uniref:tripartite tricarboxylate transporter substrate-binding protein n=1 Tax=Neisseria sp. P0015.S009 TaxID=3436765 RepID=UPI003F7E3F4F
IVPYPAGGGTDIIARLIGTQLSQRLGQAVVVENKPGASGILGNDTVDKAPGDGYTVLMGITTVVQIPALYKKVPYKLSDL